MNTYKCEKCFWSRPIVSENSYHFVCSLSQKKAVECVTNKKSHFVTVKYNTNKVIIDEGVN